MKQSHTSGADYSGNNKAIAIVSARFNGKIVQSMRSAATQTLISHGVQLNSINNINVPGAFELPIACKTLASTDKYDGVIALACVIRGETPHFDYVCQATASGIQQACLETNVPIAFGVLTTDTEEQAQNRSSSINILENKGHDAALCILEMVNILKSIGK